MKTKIRVKRSILKPFQYPEKSDFKIKTYYINLKKSLSPEIIFIFKSFQNKNLYYVVDDISYLLHSKSVECLEVFTLLFNPILSICNNGIVNLFDIWVYEIYTNDKRNFNKFLNKDLEEFHYMVIKFAYKSTIQVDL